MRDLQYQLLSMDCKTDRARDIGTEQFRGSFEDGEEKNEEQFRRKI